MTAGSATLVSLMAVEMEANHAAAVDAPAGGGGGQSDDDIAFVRQATENARKEIQSARDALLQLQNPELIRVAEMLVNDHSGANQRLSKIAEAKQWPLPAPQMQTAPPSGAASSNFDAKWTAEMIAGMIGVRAAGVRAGCAPAPLAVSAFRVSISASRLA